MRKLFLIVALVFAGFAVNINAQDCTGTTAPYYSGLGLGQVAADSGYVNRIPNASVDIQRNVSGSWYYYTTVYTDYNGNWEFQTIECGDYRAGNVQVPLAYQPCTLAFKWRTFSINNPYPYITTGVNNYCV